MTREEFMDIVYSELHSDGDNNRANRIIDAADEYAEEQTRWILCSERLPKTTDYYLVTVGINEYGLMIPSVRTALYNAETKDFTVHTGTNMCIVGNVTAWRDCLPDPYKQEVEG